MSAHADLRPPNLQVEDYVTILRGLVAVAWVALAGLLLAEQWVRQSPLLRWPEFGGFTTTFNLVLLEFGLNTLVLTVLVVSRDWYEKVPRAALERVRWLAVVVVAWLGLHYFALFHITGSLGGPLLPMLPVLLVAALLVFPARGAWWTVVYLLGGQAIVLLLEREGFLRMPAPLADAFAYQYEATPLGAATIAAGLITALALARTGWRRFEAAGVALHRNSRTDAITGLFTPGFLMQRLERELNRTRRLGGSTALLVLECEGFNEHIRRHGYEAGVELLRQLARKLMAHVRLLSDTPARLAPTTFALLLPGTGIEAAQAAQQRIVAAARDLPAGLQLRCGIAVVGQSATLRAADVAAAASQALWAAVEKDTSVELRVVE